MTTVGKLCTQVTLLVSLVAGSLPVSAADATHGKSICTVRHSGAAMIGMVPAQTPELAQLQGLAGTAVVRLGLAKNGNPSDAVVVESTGSALLDSAARRAALAQTYAPETNDCAAVGGNYLVRVEFAS